MTEEKDEILFLDETRDSQGNIVCGKYHEALISTSRIVEEFKAPTEINSDHELSVAILNQDKLIDLAKAIARRRLKVTHAEMKKFEDEVKTLEKMIKDCAKEYEAPIKAYMEKTGKQADLITYEVTIEEGQQEGLLAYLKENKIHYSKK